LFARKNLAAESEARRQRNHVQEFSLNAKTTQIKVVLVPLVLAAVGLVQASFAPAQPQSQPAKSRRSERVHMQEVQVASPDGKIKFTVLPNAERLTLTVTRGDTVVIEPSPVVVQA